MAVRPAGANLANQAGNRARASDDAKREDKIDDQQNDSGGPSRADKKLTPKQVNTARERQAADARKHAAEMDDEAVKHMQVDDQSVQQQQELEEEKKAELERINWDEHRKKRGKKDEDGTEEESAEEKAAKAMGMSEGKARYFEDLPDDRMGDLALTDPNQIKRQLGPSVRFAQHAMIIAHDRMKAGMPRQEAIEFLASLYLGVADRKYARKAIRQFGAGTGILDIYPLELMGHLLNNVPHFLPKVRTGSFFKATKKGGWKTETGAPITLEYQPHLRIRGFAIKNGERPGYLFEPIDPPGHYQLTFNTAGKWTVMISALDKQGQLFIDELVVEVTQGATANLQENASMQRAKSNIEEPPDAEAEEEKKKKKKKDLSFTIKRYV